jgi:magnesium transporter
VIVDCALYENGVRKGGDLALSRAFDSCRGPDAFVWIGLYEPTEQEFDAVRREFQLHELAVEDAITAHQRPKLEVYGDMLFIVLKTAHYPSPCDVELGEIQLFVGESFIVSVRHGPASRLGAVRRDVEPRPELVRHGPGAVLHAIIDKVVDDYGPVVDGLEGDITALEADVFSPAGETHAERIYTLKREVIEFRRALTGLVEPLEALARGRHQFIAEEIRPYFRDVEDHLLRFRSLVDGYSELLTGVLEASLIQLTVRQNEAFSKQGEDVRKISAWAAIIAVPTAIAGIYGMNFDDLPGLRSHWGLIAVLAVIAVVCVFLYFRLRRSGWL